MGLIKEVRGFTPKIGENCFIAENATIIGDTVIGNTPTELPLFFISGGMDPVGEYGQGVRSAVIKYLERGCEVSLKIYREARHELIFELNCDEVMKDILDFIIRHC